MQKFCTKSKNLPKNHFQHTSVKVFRLRSLCYCELKLKKKKKNLNALLIVHFVAELHISYVGVKIMSTRIILKLMFSYIFFFIFTQFSVFFLFYSCSKMFCVFCSIQICKRSGFNGSSKVSENILMRLDFVYSWCQKS